MFGFSPNPPRTIGWPTGAPTPEFLQDVWENAIIPGISSILLVSQALWHVALRIVEGMVSLLPAFATWIFIVGGYNIAYNGD
jgi:hypothetical protein